MSVNKNKNEKVNEIMNQ